MGFLYFVVFFQEQNNLSLSISLGPLSISPTVSFKKNYVLIFGLAFQFWVLVNKTTSLSNLFFIFNAILVVGSYLFFFLLTLVLFVFTF